MKNVFLITCTKAKADKPLPAKDLYISNTFILSRKIAEKYGDIWFIISAKHGLLNPEKIISPYDLDIQTLSKTNQNQWADKIAYSLSCLVNNDDHIIFLGDNGYYDILNDKCRGKGVNLINPLSNKSDNEKNVWMKNIANDLKAFHNLNHLYELIYELKDGLGGFRKFNESHGKMNWPNRGIYLIFDDNECRIINAKFPRIIRVGTHAVTTQSKSSLWQRLRSHRGMPGNGGNHRSSVFRHHVGDAIKNKHYTFHDVISWNSNKPLDEYQLQKENKLERAVTEYIGNMKILWLAIEDPPSPMSDRSYLERNIIALISNRYKPIDVSSDEWLGHYSSKKAIIKSGLWNIDYVNFNYDEHFLEVFEKYVKYTVKGRNGPSLPIAPKGWYKNRKKVTGPNQLTLDMGDCYGE